MRSDGGASLAHSSCEAEVVASEWGGERLGRAEESRDAGAHLAEGVEDAVQDDEEREDGLDGVQGAADDEAHDGPAEEAEGHGLLAADAVHKKTADDTAGEVETVDYGLACCQRSCLPGLRRGCTHSVSNVLCRGVVWVELGNDGGRKYAEGISDEIIAKD